MNERLTLQLVLHNDRLRTSILVSATGDPHKVFPLPRGQIEWKIIPGQYVELAERKLAIVEVVMPVWLANEKGFELRG